MENETRDRILDYKDESILDCLFIVANEDLCEITDYAFQCTTFKEAEQFLNTVGRDEHLLRCLHVILNVEHEDISTTRLCCEEFDNYKDSLEFLSHINWSET